MVCEAIGVIFSCNINGKPCIEQFSAETSTKCHSKSRHRKKWSSPICYYANSPNTFRLLISGDIEPNPGPICSTCNKTVRINSRRLECEICRNQTHQKCAQVSSVNIPNARTPAVWTCFTCSLSYLPFFHVRDLNTIENVMVDNLEPTDQTMTDDPHLNIFDQKGMKIAHLNTQSISSTFTEFEKLMYTYKFDIMTLSETWLKHDANLLKYVKIHGYKPEYNHRPTRGGGVGMFIREELKYKVRKDIVRFNPDIEHLWIEVKGRNKNHSYLVASVYQPKSDSASKDAWIQNFEAVLAQVNNVWDGPIIICGDTNIDTLTYSPQSDRYNTMLDQFNCKNHVKKATHFCKSSIDHIITNIPDKVQHTDVIPCKTISDHDCPYILINIKGETFRPRYKYIRNYKNFDLTKYMNEFSQLPINIVYAVSDPVEKLDIFNSLICECINNHAPLVRSKITRPPAPWMKELDLIALQKKRDDLRKRAHETQSHDDWCLFREVRKVMKIKIKDIKRNFYRNALSSNRPKEVWQTIHRILNPSNNPLDEDPDKLNQHFNTTSERLTPKLRKSSEELRSIIDNLPDHAAHSFVLRPTTYEEVKSAINKCRNDCSTGPDSIPINLLKPVSDFIISPLTHIINSFIESSVFPKVWKEARISPIPKIPSPQTLSDYRPVSVLPVLSKVYERIIMIQLTNFIDQARKYQQTQHGFRKSHSTVTCLLKMRDDIIRAMGKGEITISVFADYSKAFDTIDYETLIHKLYNLNMSKDFLYWVVDYLSERCHHVTIDDRSSSNLICGFGVPQGSILGPILFNLYVADLSTHLKHSKSLQYADDTNVYKHGKPKHLNNTKSNIEEDINTLKTWSSESNLVFNKGKTKSMYLCTTQLQRSHEFTNDQFTIKCGGDPIELVEEMRVLGVIFDKHLTWKSQINKTIKDCYSTLRTLKLIRRLMPFNIRRQLATTLILSKLDYANVVTYDIPQYQINKLQKVQNAAASFVLNRKADIRDVIKLKWLPIKERMDYAMAVLAFKAIHDPNSPSNVKLKMKEDRRVLRNETASVGPKIECYDTVKSFQAGAALVFNDLPKRTRENLCLISFKNETRNYLFDRATARNFE